MVHLYPLFGVTDLFELAFTIISREPPPLVAKGFQVDQPGPGQWCDGKDHAEK
jgi:hypothetical protein